jgi:hypothetical protein
LLYCVHSHHASLPHLSLDVSRRWSTPSPSMLLSRYADGDERPTFQTRRLVPSHLFQGVPFGLEIRRSAAAHQQFRVQLRNVRRCAVGKSDPANFVVGRNPRMNVAFVYVVNTDPVTCVKPLIDQSMTERCDVGDQINVTRSISSE